jgi:hypothetical protein
LGTSIEFVPLSSKGCFCTIPTTLLRRVSRSLCRPHADEKDAPKVEQAMRESVLPPSRYPTIEFVSRIVTAIDGGVQVVGDLVIAQRTRPVAVNVTIARRGDTLTATGTFSVKQTDFGMKPYSAAGGTIKVADEVTFDFEAIAIRVVDAE